MIVQNNTYILHWVIITWSLTNCRLCSLHAAGFFVLHKSSEALSGMQALSKVLLSEEATALNISLKATSRTQLHHF